MIPLAPLFFLARLHILRGNREEEAGVFKKFAVKEVCCWKLEEMKICV